MNAAISNSNRDAIQLKKTEELAVALGVLKKKPMRPATHHALLMQKTQAIRSDVIITFLRSCPPEMFDCKTSMAGFLYIDNYTDAGWELLGLTDEDYFSYMLNYVLE